jgi:hypothetical protein
MLSIDACCAPPALSAAEQTLMLAPGSEERVPPILRPAFLHLLQFSALSGQVYRQYYPQALPDVQM